MRHEPIPRTAPPIAIARVAAQPSRRALWASLLPRPRAELMRVALAVAAGLLDIVAIVATGAAIELAYHLFAYGTRLPLGLNVQAAVVVALLVVIPNVFREEYSLDNYLSWTPHPRRLAPLWTIAFLLTLTLGFVTKTTEAYSRLQGLALFAAGLPVLLTARFLMVRLVQHSSRLGASAVRRVFLIGYEADIEAFNLHDEKRALGCRVVGATYLRDPKPSDPGQPGSDARARRMQLDEDIALAVSTVRFLHPDDVFLLMPWSNAESVERCVDAFLNVPTALHLRPQLVMERFNDIQVARVGRLTGLNVARRPLTILDVVVKRSFDLVLSTIALILLAPLFAAVAVMIKLDSPGPVFFVQRRYGFNQQAFRAYKFRSMRVEGDKGFRQATRGDDRITKVGRLLRRWNIDELPQLVNVIGGEMSLVGPRPHALAHDRAFERRIAFYARRHNVKPGITGWAQVNGYRGETSTDEQMRNRVEYDLHYIDHWSIWLDLKILFLTVVSPKAYRNAF